MTEKNKTTTKQKFADYEYPIQVVGRHLSVTEAMKSYAIEKLSKIEHFGGRILDATIVMDIQRQMHLVDFVLNVSNTVIKVSGQTKDMYASIDQAIDHLRAKLKRYIGRLHDHHNRGAHVIDLNVQMIQRMGLEGINDAIEEKTLNDIEAALKPGQIVAMEKRPLKTLTTEEAIMKMDLAEAPFYVYRNERDRKLKVIYRCDDERHYGIIELPE